MAIPDTPTKYKTLHSRVCILPSPRGDASPEGALYIPETCRDRSSTGIVLATGPGYWLEDEERWRPCLVRPGDRVIFSRFIGTVIRDHYGVEYLFTLEEHLWGILDESVNIDQIIVP